MALNTPAPIADTQAEMAWSLKSPCLEPIPIKKRDRRPRQLYNGIQSLRSSPAAGAAARDVAV